MSGYELLKTRMKYYGITPQKRMDNDKNLSLKNALLSSYQSEVIEISNGGLFRALINPDKLTEDINSKILSIPYRDVCLNYSARQDKYTIIKERIETIDIKEGDVILQKRTNTHWLIFLQYLEESAYFRSQILKCTHGLLINDNYYYIHFRTKPLSEAQWLEKSNIYWNKLNNSALFYITYNEETKDFFKRFKKIKIDDNTWEVQSAMPINNNKVLMVLIKEYFNNSIEEAMVNDMPVFDDLIDPTAPCIIGESVISPYDIKEYEIMNIEEGGKWLISNNKAIIKEVKKTSVIIEIITGKSGNFDLIYKINDKEIVFPITIKSL